MYKLCLLFSSINGTRNSPREFRAEISYLQSQFTDIIIQSMSIETESFIFNVNAVSPIFICTQIVSIKCTIDSKLIILFYFSYLYYTRNINFCVSLSLCVSVYVYCLILGNYEFIYYDL